MESQFNQKSHIWISWITWKCTAVKWELSDCLAPSSSSPFLHYDSLQLSPLCFLSNQRGTGRGVFIGCKEGTPTEKCARKGMELLPTFNTSIMRIKRARGNGFGRDEHRPRLGVRSNPNRDATWLDQSEPNQSIWFCFRYYLIWFGLKHTKDCLETNL